MDCPDEAALVRAAEGHGVSPPLEQHLDACAACRALFAELVRHRTGRTSTSAGEVPPAAALEVGEEPPPGTSLGRYRVERRLGAGAMGVVYAARDPALERTVALKLLHAGWLEGAAPDEARARLLREAQLMARLSSRHVVTVHDVGSYHGRVFVAMELIEGTTLAAWLAATRRPWRDVLARYLEAGRGLAAAHAAGLVHRDFKPDNVLVGQDGRVAVTDFGLAALAGQGSGRPADDAPVEALTRSGTLLGTPAYMAPEQLAGTPADARSDQFSFCVSLWEGLFGARPFPGGSVRALREAMSQGALFPAPSGQVPAGVRRALARGLSLHPADRYPSMAALLETLAPRPRRALPWAVGAAAALALAAVGVALFRPPGAVCRGAEAHLGGVWDAPRRAAVREAFLRTRVPFAEGAFTGFARELDAYAEAWTRMHTDACEATRVRGEQPEDLLGLRMACLYDRLRELDAMAELLTRADAALVQRQLAIPEKLSALTACADERGLRAPLPPPGEPDAARRVEALRGERARVAALGAAGRYAEALPRARALAEQARALRYRPLEAEVLLLLADLETGSGDHPAAERSFKGAVLAAEAGGHLHAEVAGWIDLVGLFANKQARYAEGHTALAHAAALLERLRDPALETRLTLNQGMLLLEEGKPAEAQALLERALTLRRKVVAETAQEAIIHNALGNALRRQGKHAQALTHQQRARALFEKVHGPEHPRVALAIKNLGNSHFSRNELEPALAHYRQALAIQEKALGPDAPELASTLNNIAAVHLQQGKLEDALTELRRALATNERVLGPEHPELSSALNNIAVCLKYLGRLDEAELTARRALAIAEQANGPEHPNCEVALVNLGDVLLARRRFSDSAQAYARAAAITEQAMGKAHPNLGEDLGGLGLALLEGGHSARALEPLSRALAISEAAQADPVNLAKIRFALARALWDAEAASRARAFELAMAARATLAGSGGRQAGDVAHVDRWLSTRQRPKSSQRR